MNGKKFIKISRRIEHWSLRYIIDRLQCLWYEKNNPDFPWLTKTSIEILDSWLSREDRGLEWGSGKSTIWFAKKVKHLTSIENSIEWFEKVNNKIIELNLTNVRYVLEQDVSVQKDSKYVHIADEFEPDSLDFILIDGELRDRCTLSSLHILKPGGILIIDNANWYLPSNSRSPDSLNNIQGPESAFWMEFLNRVKSWRCIWTTSGVYDTVFYIKPAGNRL